MVKRCWGALTVRCGSKWTYFEHAVRKVTIESSVHSKQEPPLIASMMFQARAGSGQRRDVCGL